MQASRSHTGNEIKRQEQPLSERVFHPDTEHPQKPHISQDVPETQMQEHRREQGVPFVACRNKTKLAEDCVGSVHHIRQGKHKTIDDDDRDQDVGHSTNWIIPVNGRMNIGRQFV